MTYLYPKPVNVRILLSHKLQRVTDQYNDKRQKYIDWKFAFTIGKALIGHKVYSTLHSRSEKFMEYASAK